MPLKRDWVDGVEVKPGEVVLLENCRFNKGEKKDDEALARKIAALCDVYVNDAFGTAHRAEATTHGAARFAKVACAGPLMAAELDALGKALASPKRPLVAIVAGSKVSTKLTMLAALAKKVDQLIVGGGIANTFLLAAGLPIGKSLAERDLVDEAKRIMAADRRCRCRWTSWWAKGLEDARGATKPANAVAADEMILDIGPKTAQALAGLARAGRHHRLERAGGRVRERGRSPGAPRRSRARSPGRRRSPSRAAARGPGTPRSCRRSSCSTCRRS